MWEKLNRVLEDMKQEHTMTHVYQNILNKEVAEAYIEHHKKAAVLAITKQSEHSVTTEQKDDTLMITTTFRDYNEAEVDRCTERYENNIQTLINGTGGATDGIEKLVALESVVHFGSIRNAKEYAKSARLNIEEYLRTEIHKANNATKDYRILHYTTNIEFKEHSKSSGNSYVIYEVRIIITFEIERYKETTMENVRKALNVHLIHQLSYTVRPNLSHDATPYAVARVMVRKAERTEELSVDLEDGIKLVDLTTSGADRRIQELLAASLLWEFIIGARQSSGQASSSLLINEEETAVHLNTILYEEEWVKMQHERIKRAVSDYLMNPLMSKYGSEINQTNAQGIQSLFMLMKKMAEAMYRHAVETQSGFKGISELVDDRTKTKAIDYTINELVRSGRFAEIVFTNNQILENEMQKLFPETYTDLGDNVSLRLLSKPEDMQKKLVEIQKALNEQGVECRVSKDYIKIDPYHYLRKFDIIRKTLLKFNETKVAEVTTSPLMRSILKGFRKSSDV